MRRQASPRRFLHFFLTAAAVLEPSPQRKLWVRIRRPIPSRGSGARTAAARERGIGRPPRAEGFLPDLPAANRPFFRPGWGYSLVVSHDPQLALWAWFYRRYRGWRPVAAKDSRPRFLLHWEFFHEDGEPGQCGKQNPSTHHYSLLRLVIFFVDSRSERLTSSKSAGECRTASPLPSILSSGVFSSAMRGKSANLLRASKESQSWLPSTIFGIP